MARGLVTASGVVLAAVIAVGTWAYVAGIAPPYPMNAAAFNGALLATLALALLGGRNRSRR